MNRREAVRIEEGEVCPSGMAEIRPQLCLAPEFAPPSIVDYHPRSTVVAEEHLVPSAKFPVVDIHGHMRSLAEPGTIDQVVRELDALNVQVYVAADNLTGDRLEATLDAIARSDYPDRFRVMAGIDFSEAGTPGWGERAAEKVEQAIRRGAIGIGEIPKSFGMTIKKADGTRLAIDDPALDPVWEKMGELGMPVLIHTAEPAQFFEPLDMNNERWLELALFDDRRNYDGSVPSFEELMEERDNVFRRHPNTTFIAAHFGWHANDLQRAERMLEEFPNVYFEVGAILYELGRQPRGAHDFFVKWQDRILFGKDSFQPTEFPYYWRVFETADEYFDYYRGYHAFWKLYGMDLPDIVLRKLYYANAVKLYQGIPRSEFP